MTAALELSRAQVLGHRRRAGALDARLPGGAPSYAAAALAGLQDSMPRAAVLSLHARMAGVTPDAWAHPSLVQLWGPRYSVYAVAADDRAVFTLGRLPRDPAGLRRAVDTAERLARFLDGRELPFGVAGHAMGVVPNSLRYGTATGRLLLRWDGARQPVVRAVPAPDMPPDEARLELARRHLAVLGPSTPSSFGAWAGVRPAEAGIRFEALRPELVPVRTPIGDGWILASDEASFRSPPDEPAAARLLPSGDAYWLLQDRERELLVPDASRRPLLWTPRVWPGALVLGGEVAGTWRRAGADLGVSPWRRVTRDEREAVEAEAASLPLPEPGGAVRVAWVGEIGGAARA